MLIISIMFQACAGFKAVKQIKASDDPYQGGNYQPVFNTWTREARIYRGLDLEMLVAATYKSVQFRRAYAEEYARIYHLGTQETLKAARDQQQPGPESIDFLIAVYVPDKKQADFSRSDSIWQIYLAQNNAKRLKPYEIRKVKKIDARLRHFFPYITPWKSVYRVRFLAEENKTMAAKDGQSAPTTLVITGVRGSASLHW